MYSSYSMLPEMNTVPKAFIILGFSVVANSDVDVFDRHVEWENLDMCFML